MITDWEIKLNRRHNGIVIEDPEPYDTYWIDSIEVYRSLIRRLEELAEELGWNDDQE